MPEPALDPLTAFVTFGDLLKYLRRRARLSQRDLSIALGYSESQVSRLESNQRTPDTPTLAALFAPALGIENEPALLARLLELAAQARGDDTAAQPPAAPVSPSAPAVPQPQSPTSGTFTFLFTDIEGSTRLRQAQPAAFPASLAKHNAILRVAIEGHGGDVFRTMGDAFCAAFSTAGEALLAALSAQTALDQAEWGAALMRVRMAVHTGTAVRRDGDYEGLSLAQVTRLLSAGHGGQTLVSAATRVLLNDHMPAGISLRDLGEYQLKDLVRQEHIYQVVVPDLPSEFPPLASRQIAPNNLPLELTSFIGREREISEARRLLRSTRLLTLTGPGGTGKTRLSLQAAAELLPEYPQGVWLVELAPITQPALVPQAVAQALGVSRQPGRPLLDVLADHLRGQTVLIVLDNCEHLVEACALLTEQLLRAAPGLRILATSREALGLAGEVTYPVPSLSLPDLPVHPPLAELAGSEAVRLFVARATAARPDFVLTEGRAAAVAQICRRLDGIPLALELAAVRTRALSVEQIAARLDDCFGLLSGGSRTAPPRQQTLRGAIDWSYDLLSDAERLLLRQLSVFAGGWTVEAAEQVAGEPVKALDTLSQLVGKSLVQSEQPSGQETRFGLHETIRQYAQEKLAAAGEAEAAHGRHLAFYLALAEAAEPQLERQDQVAWLNQLERENDNLRAALSWALETQRAEGALRLAGALVLFWGLRGYDEEGRRYLAEALNLPASHGSLERSRWRAKALSSAGWLKSDSEADAADAWLAESVSIYRELGNQTGLARALFHVSIMSAGRNSPAALAAAHEALALWTAAEDDGGVGLALWSIGGVLDAIGDRTQALVFFQRSEARLGAAGDRLGRLWPLSELAWQAWLDGDGARARALLTEIHVARNEAGEKMGDWWTLHQLFDISLAQGSYDLAREEALAFSRVSMPQRSAAALHVRLGQVDYLQGHLPEARAHFEAGLKQFRELNDHNGQGWTPPWLGCVAYRLGDLNQARRLIDEGLAIHDPDGYWPELASALLGLGDVTRAQGDPAAAARHYTRSLNMMITHGIRPDVAQHLEAFAKLALADALPERAARLFGAGAALREKYGTPVPPVERADHDQALAQTRAQLDAAAFSAAWAEGMAWTWEQATAYVLEH